MTHGRSEQGPPDKESREKLVRICDRAVVVMDGLTVVSSFLNEKGLAIAVITRLLAIGLRFVAMQARRR